MRKAMGQSRSPRKPEARRQNGSPGEKLKKGTFLSLLFAGREGELRIVINKPQVIKPPQPPSSERKTMRREGGAGRQG